MVSAARAVGQRKGHATEMSSSPRAQGQSLSEKPGPGPGRGVGGTGAHSGVGLLRPSSSPCPGEGQVSENSRERQSWSRGSEVRKQVARELGQEQVKKKEPRGNLCAVTAAGTHGA